MIQPEENGRETEIWNTEEAGRTDLDRLRSGQPEGVGSSQRAINVGICGEGGTGSPITTIATVGSLNGGILRRLKQAEQRRLAEAKECIDWYKRQQEDAENALAELAALERLEREQRGQLNGH